MIYSEDFYLKQYKDAAQMVKFLQECKLAGSYETRLDLNNVIRLISNQDSTIKNLRNELSTKTYDNKVLLEKLQAKEATCKDAPVKACKIPSK